MQKKLITAAIASLVAGQAMAITVVDDGTNKVAIGGHIGMRYVDQDSSHATAGDSSRINFGFESKLTQDTTAFAMAEWGFNTTTSGDESDSFFFQRLGYVGAKNDQLGSISFGKQWSTYYTIAGWTDVFATTGGDAVGAYGDDGEVLGTSRADDALQYNGSFGGLNLSAQYQAGSRSLQIDKDGSDVLVNPNYQTRDYSYGLGASYDLPMGLSFGVAYNEAKLKDEVAPNTDAKNKAKSAIVGVKFEADKIYAAFTYAELKNRTAHDYLGLVEKAKGYELYAGYQFNENFMVETGYNQLKDKSGEPGLGEVKYFPLGLIYTTGPIQLSGTYQFEDSKDAAGQDVDDKLILQARYYF